MKQLFCVWLSAIACLGLAACGGSATTSSDTSTQGDTSTQTDTLDQNGDVQALTTISVAIEASKGGTVTLPGHATITFPPNSLSNDTTVTLELLPVSQAGGKGSAKKLNLSFKPKATLLVHSTMTNINVNFSFSGKVTNTSGVVLPALALWESDSVGYSVSNPDGSGVPVMRLGTTGEVKELQSGLIRAGTLSLYNTHARIALTKDGAYGGDVMIENTYDTDLVIAFRWEPGEPYFKTTIKPGETKSVGPIPAGSCDSGTDVESVEFEILGNFNITAKTVSPLGEILIDGANAYLNLPKTKSAGLGANVKYTRKCTTIAKGQVDLRKTVFEAQTIYKSDYAGDVTLGKLKLFDSDGVAVGPGTFKAPITFKTYNANGVALPADNTKMEENQQDGTFTLSLTKWGNEYSQVHYIRISVPGDSVQTIFQAVTPTYPEMLLVKDFDENNTPVATIKTNIDKQGQIIVTRTDVSDPNNPWLSDELVIEYAGTRVPLGPLDFVKTQYPSKAIGEYVGAYDPLTTTVYDAAKLKVTKRTWTTYDKIGGMTVQVHTMIDDENGQFTWRPENDNSKTVIKWDTVAEVIDSIEFHEKTPPPAGVLQLKFKYEYTYRANWVSNDFLYSYKLSDPASGDATVDLSYTFGERPEAFTSDNLILEQDYLITFDGANTFALDGPGGARVELSTDSHNVVTTVRRREKPGAFRWIRTYERN